MELFTEEKSENSSLVNQAQSHHTHLLCKERREDLGKKKAKTGLVIFRNDWLFLGEVESNLETRLEVWIKDLL